MATWSKTGDGQDRVTINNKDGSTRDVTKTKDGSLVVTDTSSSGKQVTGDGAPGFFGSMTGATRLNSKP
jgi:hypothetical protein